MAEGFSLGQHKLNRSVNNTNNPHNNTNRSNNQTNATENNNGAAPLQTLTLQQYLSSQKAQPQSGPKTNQVAYSVPAQIPQPNSNNNRDPDEGSRVPASLSTKTWKGAGSLLSSFTGSREKEPTKVLHRPVETWLPDDAVKGCQGCGVNFTIVRRRHHCRGCGGIFCDQCSSYRMKVQNSDNESLPVRVCIQCFWNVVPTDDVTSTPPLTPISITSPLPTSSLASPRGEPTRDKNTTGLSWTSSSYLPSQSTSSFTISALDNGIKYNDAYLISTNPQSFLDIKGKHTVNFPFINKNFFKLSSRVRDGDAFLVRDTAKLGMEDCSGIATNPFSSSFSSSYSSVPSAESLSGGQLSNHPPAGIRIDSDHVKYQMKDCFFSGLVGAFFVHSFLHCIINGGEISAKPGCAIFIGAGVEYDLEINRCKLTGEPFPQQQQHQYEMVLPKQILHGYGLCVGGPCKITLVDCIIKAGVGIYATGPDCTITVSGGSIIGREAAVICQGDGVNVNISSTTMVEGEVKTIR